MSHLIIKQSENLIKSELIDLNQLIRKSTTSEVVLINQISEYIIFSGGKRIRPMILLLIFKALCSKNQQNNISNKQNKEESNSAVLLAAVIEFIHTSTLLHDDVVDNSEIRRNKKSAHQVWGNAASVLVGDFLYSRSFQMMLKMNNFEILKVLANATNSIAEGEVLQLLETQNSDLSEKKYFEIINRKTAELFASAAEIAVILAEKDLKQSKKIRQLAKKYGKHLGILFQMVDDSLDYFGDEKKMGKNKGDDWMERKVTLPLIFAFKSSESKWFLAEFNSKSNLNKSQTQTKIENTKLSLVIAKLKKLEIDKQCLKLCQFQQKEAIRAIEAMKRIIFLEKKTESIEKNQYFQNLADLLDWLVARVH